MRKFLVYLSAFISALFAPFLFPLLAFAQTATPAVTNVGIQPPSGAVDASLVSISNIPQFVLNLLFLIGIVVAVAFLIYGGIRWVLSRGDKAAVDAARAHIVAAIVGLIIVVAAFVIVGVVFSLLGVANPLDKRHFQLPTLISPGPVAPVRPTQIP